MSGMKKILIGTAVLTLVLSAMSYAAGTNGEDEFVPVEKPKNFAFKVAIQPVFLIGGESKVMFDGTIAPNPERYSGYTLGLDFDFWWFFVGADLFGLYYANTYNYKPLKIFNLNVIRAGFNGKLNLMRVMSVGKINAFAKAGIGLAFFDLEQDYKNFLGINSMIAGPATGVMFCGGGGLEIDNNGLIFGLGVFVDYLMPQYSGASSAFQLMVLRIPLYLGISF